MCPLHKHDSLGGGQGSERRPHICRYVEEPLGRNEYFVGIQRIDRETRQWGRVDGGPCLSRVARGHGSAVIRCHSDKRGPNRFEEVKINLAGQDLGCPGLACVSGDKNSQGVGKLLGGTRVTTGIKHPVINGETHDVEFISPQLPGVLRPQVQSVVTGEKEILAIGGDAMDVLEVAQTHALGVLCCAAAQEQSRYSGDGEWTTHH